MPPMVAAEEADKVLLCDFWIRTQKCVMEHEVHLAAVPFGTMFDTELSTGKSLLLHMQLYTTARWAWIEAK